jgi:hypothetical protein
VRSLTTRRVIDGTRQVRQFRIAAAAGRGSRRLW